MTNPTQKKLSRRDAIKILGAVAGASVLANLPTKWSKPQLTTGVLPAHAQTSVVVGIHSLVCGANGTLPATDPTSGASSVTVSPADSGINLNYAISLFPAVGGVSLTSPGSFTGTVPTNGSGVSSIPFILDLSPVAGLASGFIHIVWTFNNPADGTGGCAQDFSWDFDSS